VRLWLGRDAHASALIRFTKFRFCHVCPSWCIVATADDVPSLLDAPADKRGKGKRRKLLDVGAMRKAAASQIRKMADSAAKSISQCVPTLLILASTLLSTLQHPR
jgi:hypothetical protein